MGLFGTILSNIERRWMWTRGRTFDEEVEQKEKMRNRETWKSEKTPGRDRGWPFEYEISEEWGKKTSAKKRSKEDFSKLGKPHKKPCVYGKRSKEKSKEGTREEGREKKRIRETEGERERERDRKREREREKMVESCSSSFDDRRLRVRPSVRFTLKWR